MPQLIILFSRWSFFIWKLQNLTNALLCCSRRLVSTGVKETPACTSAAEGPARGGAQAPLQLAARWGGFAPLWNYGGRERLLLKDVGEEKSSWGLKKLEILSFIQ